MACGCKKTTLLTCIAFLAVVLAIGVVVSCGKAGDPDSDSNSGRDSAVSSEEPVDVSLSDVSMELGYRVTRPVKELKHFERVSLKPGESRQITVEIPVADLAFWGADGTKKVEPGDFQLWIAGDSASGEPVSFRVE